MRYLHCIYIYIHAITHIYIYMPLHIYIHAITHIYIYMPLHIYFNIYMPLHKYWYRCSTRATSLSSQQDTHNYKYFKVDYSYHVSWLHSTNGRQEQSKPKRHPKLEHMPIYLLSPCHRVSVSWHATRCNSEVVSVRYKKASAKCSCCIQRKRNCQIERRHNMHATD